MAYEDRVNLIRANPLQQSWHSRVPDVYKQPESVVFNQVAAACLSRRRPGAATAKNPKPHRKTLSAAKGMVLTLS